MASISSKGAKGHHTYKLTLTEASTSTANNTSTINYTFELIDDANWFWESWGNSITYSISANGSVIKSGSISNHTTKNQTIASGSFTVPHNADGSKSISYSFTVTDNANQSYTSGNASASGTMALTKIPRYATVTQTFVSKTETSVTYSWTSDSTIDYIWVSINNGSTWKEYDIVDGKYLYNRCHLIGFQLTGENSNKENLITNFLQFLIDNYNQKRNYLYIQVLDYQ